MIPKLALLSGKGGCGKTTLAVSFTKMLTDGGVRTLLVDCDLNTNGATCFFQDFLKDAVKPITLASIVFADEGKDFVRDPKNENLFFIPSIESTNDIVESSNAHFEYLGGRINDLCDLYDIQAVIFDCSAGFSPSVNAILKYSTSAIIVLEPDSISASSFRVLKSKLDKNNPNSNINCILNKVLPGEYDGYSKLPSFSRFKPIRFDINIRQVVAAGEIPSIENTDSSYGNSLYALAKKVFPDLEKYLDIYIRKILLKESSEIEASVSDHKMNLENLRVKKILFKYRIIFNIALQFTSIIAFMLFIYNFINMNYPAGSILLTGIIGCVITTLFILLIIDTKRIMERINSKEDNSYKYEENKKIEQLLNRLETVNKQLSDEKDVLN